VSPYSSPAKDSSHLLEKNHLSSEKKLKCTAVTSTNPYLSIKQSGFNQVSDLSNLNSLLQSRQSDNLATRK